MVKQVIVTRTDDITGDDGAELVPFSFGGADYEIDLLPENAEKLRAVFQPYKEAGRRVDQPVRRSRTRPNSTRSRDEAIREWARSAGRKISDRGRIPVIIRAEYEATHPEPQGKPKAPEPAPDSNPPEQGPSTLAGLRATSERKPRGRARSRKGETVK